MTCFKIFLLSCLVVAAAPALTQSADSPLSAKARAIQESAIVVDTHADTPQRFLDEDFDIGSTDPNDIGHISLEKARRGNLGAEFFSIWVEPETNQGHYAQHTFDLIDSVYEQARHHPDKMMMAFSTQDILTAHREHKFAALLGVEGGHAIDRRSCRRRGTAARQCCPRGTCAARDCQRYLILVRRDSVAVAVSDHDPSLMNKTLAAAHAAGIPVVLINAGCDNADIAAPGQFTIQQHLNYVPLGVKSPPFPGGLISNNSINGTPEFAYGVTDWWEVGLYLPFAI